MSHPGKGSQPAKDLVQPVQVSQHGEASEQSTSSPEVQESPTSSYSIPSEGIFPIDRQGYSFPYSRLRRKMKDSMKTPLVLVACGSFNPVTFLHLRLFEIARDYTKSNTTFEVVGGYLSPVAQGYNKASEKDLASAKDRINMCWLASSQASDWVMTDPWEAIQESYVPTAQVLDRFKKEVNSFGGVETSDGGTKEIQIGLLAGADLIESMSKPGVWSQADLTHIFRNYPTLVVERAGTNRDKALGPLRRWAHNIHFMSQLIVNDISATKIRLFIKQGMSIRYLTPDTVIQYIGENNLYDTTTGGGVPPPA